MIITLPHNSKWGYLDQKTPLLFFDGLCHLCSGLVQKLLRLKTTRPIFFMSLQSRQGQAFQEFVAMHQGRKTGSMLLLYDAKIYTESDAALALGEWMVGNRFWSKMARYLPGSLRDFIYRIVAQNRYRWWGKREVCMIPDPKFRDRFVEDS